MESLVYPLSRKIRKVNEHVTLPATVILVSVLKLVGKFAMILRIMFKNRCLYQWEVHVQKPQCGWCWVERFCNWSGKIWLLILITDTTV